MTLTGDFKVTFVFFCPPAKKLRRLELYVHRGRLIGISGHCAYQTSTANLAPCPAANLSDHGCPRCLLPRE